jgi:hypothetical protein
VNKVNNAKSVVAHQVQHQFEIPMVFGSLNKALLNKGSQSNNSAPAHIIQHCSSSFFCPDENCNFLIKFLYRMLIQEKTVLAHHFMMLLHRDRR